MFYRGKEKIFIYECNPAAARNKSVCGNNAAPSRMVAVKEISRNKTRERKINKKTKTKKEKSKKKTKLLFAVIHHRGGQQQSQPQNDLSYL